MADDEDETLTTVGRVDAGQLPPDEEDMIPAFIVPDPESRSGWRYYHVKRRKPGSPPRRQIGYQR